MVQPLSPLTSASMADGMRKSLPNSFDMDAEDIASIARVRLEGVDIDSAYELLMEADRTGNNISELTDAQAWALRALGWVGLAYETQADGWIEGESHHLLVYAQNCLGESTHEARKPAEFSAIQSNRGKGKRGSIGPLKLTLAEIGSYDAFIALMADEEDLADFNESDPPHPCKLTDITDDQLGFIVRKSGESTSRPLTRIKNIIRYELN